MVIHLLTEFEIGVPNVSAAVDNKLFLGVSWTFLNHWTRLTHCRLLLDMTSRVSIYRMCCKCYELSALAAVAGNSTFLNITLKVARRNGVNCNKQFAMVIHLFSLRIGTFSTERGMGQFISAAAFKLRQSFSTSTDFIRIGSRVFIFDRRQWISTGAFNFGMDIQ